MELFAFSWQMLVILLLVLANGFFVASEFAIVKLRATQLKPLLQQKDWRAALTLRILKNLGPYLSATQMGITLASLALGWLGEPFMARWLYAPLVYLGLTNQTALATTSYAVTFGIITFLHIVLGELTPKSLAIQRPRPISLWVAPGLIFCYYLFFPFIWILNGSANFLLRSMGIAPISGSDHHAIGPEELQYVLMRSHHPHSHDELINTIMIKALRLRETRAEQVMLPLSKVVVLWRDKSLEGNLMIAQRTGYSRLPLCGTSTDEVIGVVHVVELLWQHQALGAGTNLIAIARPVLTFTPKTQLPTMLELFRQSRNHLAVVVDPDDRMLGIVTFEDVLEELVGDIRDEFDIEKGPFFERTSDSVLIDAELPLRDLASETGWPLPTHTTETVEKWLLGLWGRTPQRGESLQFDGLNITAEQVSARGLRRVRITQTQLPQEDETLNM